MPFGIPSEYFHGGFGLPDLDEEIEHTKEKKYTLKGKLWYAGDDIYIGSKDSDSRAVETCLSDFMKENIKENADVTIIINVE